MPTTRQQAGGKQVAVPLQVNGVEHMLVLEPRRTLLDALRNDLHLTGQEGV
jgi:xanthine dehydrogenase YagT iron-sulfur-binding subunit